MGGFDKIMEGFNTIRTAKKRGRTYKQQEYRNNLAKNLKELRTRGDEGKDLAKVLLKEEKLTDKYFDSLGDKKLSKNDAESIITGGHSDILVKHLDKFEGLDKKIVEELFKQGFYKEVAKNLDKFEGLDKEIAEKLDEHDHGYLEYVAYFADRFNGLDDEIIDKFFEPGYWHDLHGNKYLRGYPTGFLANNLEKFGLNDEQIKKIGERFMKEGDYKPLVENLEKFKGLLDNNEVAEWALSYTPGDFSEGELVALNLRHFKGLNKEIAKKLIEFGFAREMVIQRKIKYRGDETWFSGNNLDSFEGLDEEIAQLLIENGCGEFVTKYPEKFGLKKGK